MFHLHSLRQIGERSRLVCLRFCLCRRGLRPLGWGSEHAPERPGLGSDPEPSLEPGTGLGMSPLTPSGHTYRECMALSEGWLGFIESFLRRPHSEQAVKLWLKAIYTVYLVNVYWVQSHKKLSLKHESISYSERTTKGKKHSCYRIYIVHVLSILHIKPELSCHHSWFHSSPASKSNK